MNRRLLAATCLTPIGLAMATPALADTTISTATTANVRTSTLNNGAPDNLVIATGGSITPTGGTAVTIDANNTVSVAGTISATGIDNVVGIGGGGGFTSGITTTGSISIIESYVQTDTNNDGVLDGAFAQGSGRYGIRLTGSAPFTGALNTGGAIAVRGNASGGVVSNVAIIGNVTNTAGVTVVGDNTVGIGLNDVTGRVTTTGAIAVAGQNAVGISLAGNISGQLTIHNSVVVTGYTAITLPTSVASLTADNLKQGGGAVIIGGNVSGGVVIAGATTTTDTTIDADNDGVADTSETTAAISHYGAAPAVRIGSATQAVTLGTIGGNTVGLVINGTVTGAGVYAGVNGNGVQIGGMGQAVTIAGGISVGGGITATSNGANATALSLGRGTAVPTLTNTGSISASSTNTAGGVVRGIVIEAGASLPTITNSGGISASAFAAADNSWAILDNSGTLTSVTNTGGISAGADAASKRAIDVSTNTSGFTYTQSQSSVSGASAPALIGSVLTGSGNDTISASAGTIRSTLATNAGNDTLALSGTAAFTGTTNFGDGNDSLTLAGTSSYTGSVDFGGGVNTLGIGNTAVFTGQLVNSGANLAVSVQGGTLAVTNTSPATIGSLAINAGTLGVNINPATGAHTELAVTGATTITGASTIKATVSGLVSGTGASYTVLRSGTLTGSSNLGVQITGLPYLLNGSLTASDSAGTVAVNIQRKTAAQLGFDQSETAAYDAVYAAITGNAQLTNLYLGFTDRDSLIQRYRQMLPDHAGGLFDLLYTGTRNMAPSESVTPWTRVGGLALWVQQSFWNANQDAKATPGYKGSGYGASGGADIAAGPAGRVGVSLSYVFANDKNRGQGSITANQFLGNVYWRGDWGNLHLAASGGGGIVRLNSRRSLSSNSSNLPELLTSRAKWNGLVVQGSGRASYEARMGAFYARPAGTLSYYRLNEKSHSEGGGGTGYDLIVGKRNSNEFAATGTLALGARIGAKPRDEDSTSITVEIEGGRREVISSSVGGTTAHFAGGQDFTLLPEDRKSGYIGTASASIGSQMFRFVASATAETRNGYKTYLGRVALRGLF
jgi:hypothetical protein